MRTFLTLLLILALIAGAIALYLFVTTPHETAGVMFPLSASAQSMIASVPASADAFAYIPRAAALQSELTANPITHDVVESWRSTRAMPRPWMVGNADLLAWQSGNQTRYLLRLDPVRAALVRIYLMAAGDTGGTVLINAPADQPIEPEEVARIVALASKLPNGNALVVQRSSSRGAFPPIGRPAASSINVTGGAIEIVSRSRDDSSPPSQPLRVSAARGAILSASFLSAPRIFDDLNRLFGKKISELVSDGGSVSLYDIDAGKLLPRPLGVITVPATGDRRPGTETLSKYGVRTAEKDGKLVISFDDTIDAYLKDATDESAVPGGKWAARVDAVRMAPILDRLRENVGLRIASPKLFRAARDLDHWIGSLQMAKTIDAIDSSDGSTEELKVRITAK